LHFIVGNKIRLVFADTNEAKKIITGILGSYKVFQPVKFFCSGGYEKGTEKICNHLCNVCKDTSVGIVVCHDIRF
jgi:hypothetical protein